MTIPTVSVCMITYNHEKYIREAIEGVLMQQCDFEVELIVANDCSTDKTDQVIQELLKNHPRASWIKYTKHEKNLGMMPNFIWAIQQCKAKYIALCDGDDYWTDPLKLQKQVDFLEANEAYVLCFHPINILKTNGEIVNDFITKVPENYETIETLARLENYIHTPSVIFRNIIKEFPFEFEEAPLGDYFLYMMLTEHGKLKYLVDIMAVYRYGVGEWSEKNNYYRNLKTAQIHSFLVNYFKNKPDLVLIFSNRITQFLKSFNNKLSIEDLNLLNTSILVNKLIVNFLFEENKKNEIKNVSNKTTIELLKVIFTRVKNRIWKKKTR